MFNPKPVFNTALPVSAPCVWNAGPPPTNVDDIPEAVARLYLKYKKGGVKADIHVYSQVGHGFAADPTSKRSDAGWFDLFIGWLSDLGFIDRM